MALLHCHPIKSHYPGVPVRQNYKVAISVHCHQLVPVPLTGLVPKLWSTASYLTTPLVSSSCGFIVAVLRPVRFPKCASSNYKYKATMKCKIKLSSSHTIFNLWNSYWVYLMITPFQSWFAIDCIRCWWKAWTVKAGQVKAMIYTYCYEVLPGTWDY